MGIRDSSYLLLRRIFTARPSLGLKFNVHAALISSFSVCVYVGALLGAANCSTQSGSNTSEASPAHPAMVRKVLLLENRLKELRETLEPAKSVCLLDSESDALQRDFQELLGATALAREYSLNWDKHSVEDRQEFRVQGLEYTMDFVKPEALPQLLPKTREKFQVQQYLERRQSFAKHLEEFQRSVPVEK